MAAKVADFQMARRRFIPPLPSSTFSRPFSVSQYLLSLHLGAGARSAVACDSGLPSGRHYDFPLPSTEHERVSVVWPQRPDVKRGGRPG